MITQATATRMLDEFENEVRRVGYEDVDKRCLNSIFGYLRLRCSDASIYSSTQKLKTVDALEKKWHQDRIGKPIVEEYGDGILGYDPAGTQRGALTIGAIIRELRVLCRELPEKVVEPAPIVIPAQIIPGLPASVVEDAVNAAVAKALAQHDAQQKAANV